MTCSIDGQQLLMPPGDMEEKHDDHRLTRYESSSHLILNFQKETKYRRRQISVDCYRQKKPQI